MLRRILSGFLLGEDGPPRRWENGKGNCCVCVSGFWSLRLSRTENVGPAFIHLALYFKAWHQKVTGWAGRSVEPDISARRGASSLLSLHLFAGRVNFLQGEALSSLLHKKNRFLSLCFCCMPLNTSGTHPALVMSFLWGSGSLLNS